MSDAARKAAEKIWGALVHKTVCTDLVMSYVQEAIDSELKRLGGFTILEQRIIDCEARVKTLERRCPG